MTSLFRTINNTAAWDNVFEGMREALDCKVVHVFAIDKQHGTMSYSSGSNLPIDG